MAWWGNAPGIHGMQEVWGSNPHSSTTGQEPISNNELVSDPLVRGILRGKIVFTCGRMTSINASAKVALASERRLRGQ
jgi:hypothetical protein